MNCTCMLLTPCCAPQNDPTVLGYNLMNEPRCNCSPKVVDTQTGLATQDNDGSDCANIKTCSTNVQVTMQEFAQQRSMRTRLVP